MMERTDRHFRVFARALSRRTLLYSEMIHADAVIRGNRASLLAYDPCERPLVLQLGGDDPVALAEAARIGADLGYDEINLNCGCPSPRVQAGNFGVVLMGDPGRVARCVAAMAAAVSVPVSVKHRIGFDDRDSYEHMRAFVDAVAAAGCARFVVHARKAWTQGLSPRENREVPPLRHAEVWRLKAERPDLRVEINGGFGSWEQVPAQLAHVDGVMVGRAAWDNPWAVLARADTALYGATEDPATDRVVAVRALLPSIERRLAAGDRWVAVIRPMLNLFAGMYGGKRFRRLLSEGPVQAPTGVGRVEAALAAVEGVSGA